MINLEQIKKLRKETGISIVECKKALEKSQGNIEKAKEILKKWGKIFAEKKKERKTGEGIISTYVHSNKKIGVMIELNCESDFVAKSKEFQDLAHELCLQIAAIDPKEIPLFEQPWIRDQTKTVKDLIDGYIAKLGENITIKRFVRYEI